MGVVNRRGKTDYGVRCDFCGKIANNSDGEYTKPGTIDNAAYIHGPPDWERNPDGSSKPDVTPESILTDYLFRKFFKSMLGEDENKLPAHLDHVRKAIIAEIEACKEPA